MFFRQPKTFLTVPQAINAGKWRVLYAPFIFLFVALRAGQILTRHESTLTFILYLLIIIVLALLYWSIAVGRWRVWAFSNTADIMWLSGRAQREHILPTNHFFMRLELQTAAQKEFWNDIQQRLIKKETPKSTLEDYELPAETVIFESKWQFWWIPLVSFVILGGLYFNIKYLFFFIEEEQSKALLFLTPIMILVVAKEWIRGVKMVFSTLEPQIILNNNGIETPEFGLKKWSKISHIDINTKGYGENRKDIIELTYLTGEDGFYREYFETWEDDDGNEFTYEYPTPKILTKRLTKPTNQSRIITNIPSVFL